MHVQESTNGKYARLLLLVGTLVFGGCGNGFNLLDGDPSRPTLNLSTLGLDTSSTYFETYENDLFEEAEIVELGAESRVIRGDINGSSDVDIYDLGPMPSGTRVVVDMTSADTLDGVIALFDETDASLLVNDHRNVYLGRSEPFVDVVIRRDSEACYVAISATPGYSATGDYALVASKEYPVSLPDPRPDVVLLVFDGGSNVRIGSRTPIDVPVFDASNVSSVYAGQTNAMVRQIVAGVREDYEGLDVTILSTSEGAEYDNGMTRMFFGTFDAALLGVAENVDEFNETSAQEAIVFTDTFAAFMQLNPTVEQMGQAIANVASHEIGHLLGLVHTDDPTAIMDITASLSQLLTDQEFRSAPLYSAVFPIGNQDALQSLLDTVGGDAVLMLQRRLKSDYTTLKHSLKTNEPKARELFYFSTCDLHEHTQ